MSQASFTDGVEPGRRSKTGCGRNSTLPQTSRPARNTFPPTGRTHSLAIIASLGGIHLSFRHWSRPVSAAPTWIPTTVRVALENPICHRDLPLLGDNLLVPIGLPNRQSALS